MGADGTLAAARGCCVEKADTASGRGTTHGGIDGESGDRDGRVARHRAGHRGALGRDGRAVVVNYTQSAERRRRWCGRLRRAAGRPSLCRRTSAAWPTCGGCSRRREEKYGRLDILVNNAGTATFTPLADVTEEDFDALFALNVKGAFFAMQEAARRLADGGRIVNISSGITIGGGPGGSVYGGTKGALEQFTLAAAKELGPRGITVNTVSPGMTVTDLMSRRHPDRAQQERMAQASPLGRLGQPDDIADVVAFLVSDAGRWVTGQNIRANGGAS